MDYEKMSCEELALYIKTTSKKIREKYKKEIELSTKELKNQCKEEIRGETKTLKILLHRKRTQKFYNENYKVGERDYLTKRDEIALELFNTYFKRLNDTQKTKVLSTYVTRRRREIKEIRTNNKRRIKNG